METVSNFEYFVAQMTYIFMKSFKADRYILPINRQPLLDNKTTKTPKGACFKIKNDRPIQWSVHGFILHPIFIIVIILFL